MKLTFLLLLSSFSLFGQTLKGVVLETTTNTPLQNVSVYYAYTKQGTTTNSNGTFRFKTNAIIKDSDFIRFSKLGYHPKNIQFSTLKATNFIVHLQVKIENLNEVVIQSTNLLRPEIRFKKQTSMKSRVHSFGSELIDRKIYVIGGDASYSEEILKKILDEIANNTAGNSFGDFIKKSRKNNSWKGYTGKLQIYDIAKNTWTTSPLKFRKRAYHNINYHNNKLYILGGKRLSLNPKYEYLDDKIELFDLQNNKITVDHTNPHQAINFLSFVYNNNLIVIGGSTKLKKNGEIITTKKIHLYDFKSGYWYQLSNMPESKEVTGVLANDVLYIVGGYDNKPISKIKSYHLITGKWKNETTLFDPIEKPALAYHKNTIYIFSDGKISTYNIVSKILHEYNINLFLKSSKLHYYDNKLYLVGGYRTYEFSKETSSSLYSIDINEFSKTKIIRSKKH